MSSIIKASHGAKIARGVAFNFDDIAHQANRAVADLRHEASRLLSEASAEAEQVRQRAEQEGREAAVEAAKSILDEKVTRQLETLLPALRKAIDEIEFAKGAWLTHWEKSAVGLATAIAARVIRRELSHVPEIPLELVREALELSVGSPKVRLGLHPADHQVLQNQIARLAEEFARIAPIEIVADPAITPGGCRVDTDFGVIDQQFESQLARIEQELT
jgi:flagellar assembly protein FliH